MYRQEDDAGIIVCRVILMKTIGLCMIVKNESQVILRCLKSVRALVDYVLIEDTGSTDGTQTLVRDWLTSEGLPGEIYDRPWTDFATNRSSALAALRQRTKIDYALIIDADDALLLESHFDVLHFKQELTADLYTLSIRLGPITYYRPQLCSNKLPFHFRGVLHEFLECFCTHTSAEAHGISMVCDRDGSRSQDSQKYQRDAATLERALETETDPLLLSRYTFYLAQSYRDQGDPAKALPLYRARADQGFWVEERFVSLYEAAKIMALLGHAASEVVGLFLEAYELCPTRAESLHGAMRFCRDQSLFHQGFLIGKHAVTLGQPLQGLFLEEWIYSYGLYDEFAVLAYWSGHFIECSIYAQRMLEESYLPEAERPRVLANLRFARTKLVIDP